MTTNDRRRVLQHGGYRHADQGDGIGIERKDQRHGNKAREGKKGNVAPANAQQITPQDGQAADQDETGNGSPRQHCRQGTEAVDADDLAVENADRPPQCCGRENENIPS